MDVKEKCESVLWDSEWYIRGITADNRKIGTQTDEEGRVHMESNTWAVLSGAAARERGIKAMDSVDEYLYTDFGLMLNAPLLHQARRRHRLRHAGLPRPQRERRDGQPPEPVGVVRRGCSGARKPHNEIL